MSFPSSADRVFIDTMVFVYFLTRKQGFLYSRSTRFMQALQNQKFIGAISTFTMTEYAAVMKEILAELFNRTPTQKEIEMSIDQLNYVINSYGIELYDADQLAALPSIGMFNQTDALVLDTDAHLGARDQEWHTLGGADAIHVNLAQRCKSQFIATFDQGFSCLKTSLKPLIIPEVF